MFEEKADEPEGDVILLKYWVIFERMIHILKKFKWFLLIAAMEVEEIYMEEEEKMDLEDNTVSHKPQQQHYIFSIFVILLPSCSVQYMSRKTQ